MEQGLGEALVNGHDASIIDPDLFLDASSGSDDEDGNMVDYDVADAADPADVYAKTAHVKVDFNRAKPTFFFVQLEMLLESSAFFRL